jgi:hypothetical protein
MNATTTTTLAAQSTEIAVLATRLENLAHLNLEEKITLKVLGEKINELIVFANALNDRADIAKSAPVSRNRGPASEKVMSEEDARRVMLGDLKDDSHKEAAEKLGLSYGQIYSARKGFTFKPVYKEMIDAIKAVQATL